MNVVIAGGTGFIGESLVKRLLKRGAQVSVLTRDSSHVAAGRALVWDAKNQGPWSSVVAAADVVINLAGENIGAGRWTESLKQRLVDSRLNSTNALVTAMKSDARRARTFISASAVGFYGTRGDEELDENGSRGSGFLADLTSRWEEAARAADSVARLVSLRFGVVLGGDGGALKKMMLPFRFGAGGPVGSGKQWISWIDREDVLRMIEWAIDNASTRGVYNATSPHPVRNVEFSKALGRAMHRPAVLPAPSFALRAIFGQMADELLLGGQRVVPSRAMREGFGFAYPDIDHAIRHALKG